MVIKFCENFLLKLRERQTVYGSRITSGTLSTLEEYKFISGKLRALEESEGILKQVYKEMFESKVIETRSEVNDEISNELYRRT